MPYTKDNIEKHILSSINGRGRGKAFSQSDFALFGKRHAIDVVLTRLVEKGLIRRVLRGIYDYPIKSKYVKNNKFKGPDIDQVAKAIARKFGWSIQPSESTAQLILGLSTQVPGKYWYSSNGSNLTYMIGNIELKFISSPLKESGFKHNESAIIVQAIKGYKSNDRLPDNCIPKIRKWLDKKMYKKVLKDTKTVSAWIYEIIKEICKEEDCDG